MRADFSGPPIFSASIPDACFSVDLHGGQGSGRSSSFAEEFGSRSSALCLTDAVAPQIFGDNRADNANALVDMVDRNLRSSRRTRPRAPRRRMKRPASRNSMPVSLPLADSDYSHTIESRQGGLTSLRSSALR